MCAVCAGSVATGRDARTSRLCVCAFVYQCMCAGSVASGRDVCTSRFVRMCVRLSVHGWGVVTVVDVRLVY